VRFRCGLHDQRAGHGDVIDVVRCLNPGEEMLSPGSLETYVGFVGRSAFDLNGMYKHTSTIFVAAEDQSIEFVIRNATECVATNSKGRVTTISPRP